MPKITQYIACLTLAGFAISTALARSPENPDQTLRQNVSTVTNKVVDFLSQQAASYPGTAHITVDAPRLQRHPACRQLQVFLPNGQKLRSRMSVGVRCLAPTPWTTRVQATLAINGFFYVPNRTLELGEIISLDHLIARKGDILSLARGIVVDPANLLGQIVTQRIPAGSPIKSSTLRSPQSVQRGQMVRTEAHGPGFIATGEGQTLQDGMPGEQIRVRTSSGQIISATVMDAQTVQVLM